MTREKCRLFQQLRAYDRPALPMVSGPPTEEGWINEIKHDGSHPIVIDGAEVMDLFQQR
jgi:hypothetical protein